MLQHFIYPALVCFLIESASKQKIIFTVRSSSWEIFREFLFFPPNYKREFMTLELSNVLNIQGFPACKFFMNAPTCFQHIFVSSRKSKEQIGLWIILAGERLTCLLFFGIRRYLKVFLEVESTDQSIDTQEELNILNDFLFQ